MVGRDPTFSPQLHGVRDLLNTGYSLKKHIAANSYNCLIDIIPWQVEPRQCVGIKTIVVLRGEIIAAQIGTQEQTVRKPVGSAPSLRR